MKEEEMNEQSYILWIRDTVYVNFYLYSANPQQKLSHDTFYIEQVKNMFII